MAKNCAGCKGAVTGREFMKCCICCLVYDLHCANVSSKRFYLMSIENKQSWKCLECRSAEPKTDNTNTPIRPGTVASNDAANVTLRDGNKNKNRRKSSDDLPSLEHSVMSNDTLRAIVREELHEMFQTFLKKSLNEIVSEAFKNFNDKISSLESALIFGNSQFEDMKKIFEDNVSTISLVQKQNETLQLSVNDLTNRLALVEQHMREANVEIGGLPEHSSENLANTVVQLSKLVKQPLAEGDDNGNRAVRDRPLAAVSSFNKANPKEKLNSHQLGLGGARVPVYVSEHLSPTNKHLHAAARRKAKEVGFNSMDPMAGLNIYYQNIRGMRTKTNAISQEIQKHDFDIILMTETWLVSSICTYEFIDRRYTVYRRDRIPMDGGGGVLIAVKNTIKSVRMQAWETSCEDIWVLLDIEAPHSNVKRVGICCPYFPYPTKDILECFCANATNVIQSLDAVVIAGDFNLPYISWSRDENLDTVLPTNYEYPLGYALVDFVNLNNLKQLNYVKNFNNRTLDLVFTNVANATLETPVDLLSKLDAHHPQLFVVLDLTVAFLPKLQHIAFNFYRADYSMIFKELRGIDWRLVFSVTNSIEEMTEIFYEHINSIIEQHVPKFHRKSHNYPPWFNNSLRKLFSEKNKLRRRSRKYNNPRDEFEYKILRERCNKHYSECYLAYIRNTEEAINKDPKKFWKYLSERRKNSNALPSLMKHDSGTGSTGNEIVNLFAAHF
ncbi:unnamed protein product [Pieris brassicae]|uniref:Endonuclease/exonuclease/phosphatase domain-containing protein n=1 Tax=Pieris brassicae TaxID=7116 RepID=A0A9P0TDU5_PIEBR|nr:unnamed protein product [Pieris brassicae]